MCKICNETQFKNIIKATVEFKFENPEAYGYPEIVYWDEKYKIKNCPFCGRELNNILK